MSDWCVGVAQGEGDGLAGKGGFEVGLDPVTGRLLWKTAVGIHRNGDLPGLTGPSTTSFSRRPIKERSSPSTERPAPWCGRIALRARLTDGCLS
jgi:hypothetical protein